MRDRELVLQDSKCAWLVQATVRGATLERLERACDACGRPMYRIDIVPFSETLPELMPTIEGPFVFYGYTTLMINAFKDPDWRRGVFFDPAIFRPSVYLKRWGLSRVLNSDARLLTMQSFADLDVRAPSTRWFIKPDDDLKRFTGGVMTRQEYLDWYAGIAALGGSADIGPDTTILVCEPKEIGHEWRIFIVGGIGVAETCYTNNGRDLPLPPELRDFVLDAVSAWSPAAAFAIDVAVEATGAPKIIEANCINGSGFYAADTSAIVRALAAWQESNWKL